MSLIIGHHARKGKKSYRAICEESFDLVREYLPSASPCVALFIAGPRNARLNIQKDIALELDARTRGSILFHCAYVDIPWRSLTATDDVIARMKSYMEICQICRADAVVHTSSLIFNEEVNARVMRELCRVIDETKQSQASRLFIETMPHDPRFANVERINAIFDDVAPAARGSIGLCIDTAHIWAAGADISREDACFEWLQGIRKDIPVAIHLNDSTQTLGSRVDVHTCLGEGRIWERDDGYMGVLEYAREREAPVILERNQEPIAEVIKDYRLIAAKLNF